MILKTDKGYFPMHRVLSVHIDDAGWDGRDHGFAYVMNPKTGLPTKVKVSSRDVAKFIVPIVMTTDGDN